MQSPNLPGHIPVLGGDPVHRHVLGPAPASGANVQVTMTPSVSGSVTGTQSGNRGGLYVGLGEQVFPITLAAPNPLTKPLLGDGTNQFVYDGNPDFGYLAVPASAIAAGATTADTTSLVPHLTFAVSPVMDKAPLPYSLTASGSSIMVSTPGNYPFGGSAFPAASYIYKGLPSSNTYFGNHVMTLKVDNQASQLANYQLFYSGSAFNWPTSDGSVPDIQNWYHYYHPLYPLAAFAADYDPSDNKPQFLAFTNFFSPYTIYMEKGTGGGKLAVPIFDINSTADPMQMRKLVRRIGTLSIQGIHRYIWIAAHEWGHQRILTMGGIYTTAVQDASGNYVPPVSVDSNYNDLDHGYQLMGTCPPS